MGQIRSQERENHTARVRVAAKDNGLLSGEVSISP